MLSEHPTRIYPRPFLKWAGGKSRLIKQYADYLPDRSKYRNYYEPFLGGGAVFFHLQPHKAILSDVNPDLVATYCCVKNNLEELICKLKEHDIYHCPDYYYHVRANPGSNQVDIAARLIYLNKTCFNGLYRVNSKGEFNVPLGKYENPKICQVDALLSASKALQNAEIRQNDFEKILDLALSSNDFVYLDPPYHPISNTSDFTAYSTVPFKECDQIRLRDVCAILANRGVKVMISNSDCQLIREIYSDINFNIYQIKASRAINSNIKRRGAIYELLITSYRN
ncbi:MAG: DNA adenine methylase [Mastigocoleus sp.]